MWNSIRVTMLSVRIERDEDIAVVRLGGELDIATIPQLRQAALEQLADGTCRQLTLNLAELTFLDSSALGALVELRRAATSYDASLRLEGVQPGAARIITIAGLAQDFGLPPSDAPTAEIS
jgi:anti-sigma B factor antagonist